MISSTISTTNKYIEKVNVVKLGPKHVSSNEVRKRIALLQRPIRWMLAEKVETCQKLELSWVLESDSYQSYALGAPTTVADNFTIGSNIEYVRTENVPHRHGQ